MPLADECAIGPQCCTTLYDVAAYLLDETYAALVACYPDPASCPLRDWRKYVTMGSGNDGIDDALTVAYLTAGTARTDSTTRQLALFRAQFEIRLRERGWPMVRVEQGGQIHAPDWLAQTAKARQALAHGEAMYRHLIWLNNGRALPPATFGCANAQIGPLTPLAPLGGVVGFTATVTIDVPWGGG